VTILWFISMAVVVLLTVGLSYCLSSVEEQTLSRRCRMPHEMHHKRKVKRQRERCRFEG
jgi:hypothetical protein